MCYYNTSISMLASIHPSQLTPCSDNLLLFGHLKLLTLSYVTLEDPTYVRSCSSKGSSKRFFVLATSKDTRSAQVASEH